MVSGISVASYASADSQVLVATNELPSTETSSKDSGDESEAVDRRKRLAMALDQTATAMEGGKSLAMAKEELCRSPQPDSGTFASMDLGADLEETKEVEKRAKMAEKRRRTIRELCETEATYACDMAVVRDIYLERARGVGELLSRPAPPFAR